jgi:hypothetical protein
MNCKEANEILITDFLYSQGIEPKKIAGGNYWYLSPLRDERTASFKVDPRINRWYDHGIGVGGKLVDLGIRLFEESVSEFLERLNSFSPTFQFSFVQQENKVEKPVIRKIKKLENKALVEYLVNRAIEPLFIAQIFCHEIYFSIDDKNYFGIGFKNDRDGYEIRNKYFKGCLGAKSITTIQGNDSKNWVLFEGFFDFLSAFQKGGVLTSYSFIILNSVNQIDQAIAELLEHKPESITAYFDNDEAGRKCFQSLLASFPGANDRSSFYEGFKDFNEMTIQTKI